MGHSDHVVLIISVCNLLKTKADLYELCVNFGQIFLGFLNKIICFYFILRVDVEGDELGKTEGTSV